MENKKAKHFWNLFGGILSKVFIHLIISRILQVKFETESTQKRSTVLFIKLWIIIH